MQCTHQPCTCQVTYDGDFCSDACRNVSAAVPGPCPCDHPTCEGNKGVYQPGDVVGDTPLGEGLVPRDAPLPR